MVAENTVRSYDSTMKKYREFLEDTEQKDSQKTALEFLYNLRESGCKPSTISRNRAALTSRLGYDLSRFEIVRLYDSSNHPIDYKEVVRVMKGMDGSLSEHRDWIIIALLYWGGLRRSEIVNIKLEDVHENSIVLRQTKTQVEQWVTIPIKIVQEIRRHRKRLDVKGYEGTHVFLSFSRNNSKGKPLTSQSINLIIKKRFGTLAKSIQFRHACITDMFENGADPKTVTDHARHSDLHTTLGTYYHPSGSKNALDFLPEIE